MPKHINLDDHIANDFSYSAIAYEIASQLEPHEIIDFIMEINDNVADVRFTDDLIFQLDEYIEDVYEALEN